MQKAAGYITMGLKGIVLST